MSVILKSKIKKGNLCICLIDHRFPPNNDELLICTHTQQIKMNIKHRTFYQIAPICKKEDITDNKIPIKYKEKIEHVMKQINEDLNDNGIHIVKNKSMIVFKKEKKKEKRCCCLS